MKRLPVIIAAIMLLAALAIPATASAQGDPFDPYAGGVHEGTEQIWMCMPDMDGNGRTCSWVYDTGHGHGHGEDDDHNDHGHDDNHRPDPLGSVAASCESTATGIRCRLSLNPTEGSVKPLRYRILFLDSSSKDRLHIEKVSPDELNPTGIEFEGESNSVLVKAQAVGECKRKAKRDKDAKVCSRSKSAYVKTTAQVAE